MPKRVDRESSGPLRRTLAAVERLLDLMDWGGVVLVSLFTLAALVLWIASLVR